MSIVDDYSHIQVRLAELEGKATIKDGVALIGKPQFIKPEPGTSNNDVNAIPVPTALVWLTQPRRMTRG